MGKRGGLRKAWKERFFVLCQGILVYYEDDSLREQCGVIELFRAVDVEVLFLLFNQKKRKEGKGGD